MFTCDVPKTVQLTQLTCKSIIHIHKLMSPEFSGFSKMSECATIYLNLPQWDGGSRKIRFIYLVDQTSFRLTECPVKVSCFLTKLFHTSFQSNMGCFINLYAVFINIYFNSQLQLNLYVCLLCRRQHNSDLHPAFQIPAVPLYLGADLFSNTNVRTENHPRYHAKFAKKGLATKINFSSGNALNTDIFKNLFYFH